MISSDSRICLASGFVVFIEQAPKYQLSHCLSPLHGNGPKWLLFTEFVEHYKLIGVEHFYVYVKDIDEYSARVLNDYVRTGEIETTFLRTNDRPGGLYLRATIRDCIHRSRHHSRYVIIGDLDERIVLSGTETLTGYVTNVMTLHPNVASLRFKARYVVCTGHLPVYYNVMEMGVHRTRLLFSNYETFFVPVADAFIRHMRYPDRWTERELPTILSYGKMETTNYPEHLMPVLYQRVKERLDRVYLVNSTTTQRLLAATISTP
ncbi:unnamed protein product [Nippostrongylus brasiliensis]|uniref:Glycosyltransferase family 92 protein n=1 Tax=Nippostrongylus brasiliensis TaxID=27835 RepID=A0A158R2T3_NIPBR|nr:unnamed protein product [Nippostrongylus brasiliensis]